MDEKKILFIITSIALVSFVIMGSLLTKGTLNFYDKTAGHTERIAVTNEGMAYDLNINTDELSGYLAEATESIAENAFKDYKWEIFCLNFENKVTEKETGVGKNESLMGIKNTLKNNSFSFDECRILITNQDVTKTEG